MNDGLDPLRTDFEEATAQLDEGLKSCRSVLRNYRAMLGTEADPDARRLSTFSGRARRQ